MRAGRSETQQLFSAWRFSSRSKLPTALTANSVSTFRPHVAGSGARAQGTQKYMSSGTHDRCTDRMLEPETLRRLADRFTARLHHPARHAHRDRIRRQRFHDDAARADDRVIADRHTLEHDAARAEPHVCSDHDRAAVRRLLHHGNAGCAASRARRAGRLPRPADPHARNMKLE